MPSESRCTEVVFFVDKPGNITPISKNALVSEAVKIKPSEPFSGEVYAAQNGQNRCAELFGIPGLDHLDLDKVYHVAKSAAGQKFTITTSIATVVTQTGELHVGSVPEE
jgi:hypothetical protein